MTLVPEPGPLILAFPEPGPRLAKAYRDLHIAGNGTPAERQLFGNPALLPRPWEPATCTNPALRAELWDWLEHVVTWFNHELAWQTTQAIPPCWPHHPHLIHDIATLADQRRRAHIALTSDNLTHWQNHTVPAFLDRLHNQVGGLCDNHHQDWPARSRHRRHRDQADAQRTPAYAQDVTQATQRWDANASASPALPLALIDLHTGEIVDDE